VGERHRRDEQLLERGSVAVSIFSTVAHRLLHLAPSLRRDSSA
jgi:hypothetical protein